MFSWFKNWDSLIFIIFSLFFNVFFSVFSFTILIVIDDIYKINSALFSDIYVYTYMLIYVGLVIYQSYIYQHIYIIKRNNSKYKYGDNFLFILIHTTLSYFIYLFSWLVAVIISTVIFNVNMGLWLKSQPFFILGTSGGIYGSITKQIEGTIDYINNLRGKNK